MERRVHALVSGELSRSLNVPGGDTPEWTNPEGFGEDIFTFARIRYTSTMDRSSYAWWTDFPDWRCSKACCWSSPASSVNETTKPSFESSEVQNWRKSNEVVRGVGGWRAYAREMHGGAPAPASAASAVVAPKGETPAPAPKVANPHEGHRQ